MFSAGQFLALHSPISSVVTAPAIDSYQAGFLIGAFLFVVFNAWHGWRLGVVRQVINILALAASYLCGYLGGGVLGPMFGRFIDLPERVLAIGGAVILGFIVYVCIVLMGAIAFKKTAQQSVGLIRFGYGLMGSLFGTFYGIFLVWIVVLAIRLLGSVAETRIEAEKNPRFAHNQPTPTPTPTPGPTRADAVVRGLAHMKQSLEQGATGAVVQQVDPIPGTLYSILRKLGVMASDEHSMERFLNYPGVKPLLAHPKIASLQNDPTITRDLVNRDYLALMRNPQIAAVATDREIGELMAKFEFEKALDYALNPPEKETSKNGRVRVP